MPVSATMLPYLLRSAYVSARTTILRSAPWYSRPQDYSSSVGIAVWTVMPNFAHTYFWEKRNLECANFVGFDFYGHNAATNYSSGTMFHWDGRGLKSSAKKRLASVRSDPTSRRLPTKEVASDALNGFAGRAWACRPNCPLFAKREKPGVSFQLGGSTKFESRTR